MSDKTSYVSSYDIKPGKVRKLLTLTSPLFSAVYIALMLSPVGQPANITTGDNGVIRYRPSLESLLAGCQEINQYSPETLKFEEITGSKAPDNSYLYPVGGYYHTGENREYDKETSGYDQGVWYPKIVDDLRTGNTGTYILYRANTPTAEVNRLNSIIKSYNTNTKYSQGYSTAVKSSKWVPRKFGGLMPNRHNFVFVSKGKYQGCQKLSAPALGDYLNNITAENEKTKKRPN